MKTGLSLGVGVLLLGFPLVGKTAEFAPSGIWANHACTSSEEWRWDSRIRGEVREQFEKFSQSSNFEKSFDLAFKLRAKARAGSEAQTLANYWLGRLHFEHKLNRLALRFFEQAIQAKGSPSLLGIKLASLQCFVRLNERVPSFGLTPESLGAVARISRDEVPAALQPAMAELAWILGRQALASNSKVDLSAWSLKMTEGYPMYSRILSALVAASKNDDARAIESAQGFLRLKELPERMKPYQNLAYLLLGRAHYNLKQWDLSVQAFQKIDRGSNYLAEALSDQSWSHLMAQQYGQAIGLFVNLQTGHLRRTYSPEGGMVAAIALYELCQYPESLKATRQFKKIYKKSFQWLNAWAKKKDSNLYGLTVKFIKDQPSAPEMIASEWVRSPVFLAVQEELNSLYDEREVAERWIEKLAEKDSQDLMPSSPKLEAMLKQFVKGVSSNERQLVGKINSDLKLRTERMLHQLSSLAENVQLIEIDIYNRASEELVVKNFNPEFEKKAKRVLSGQEKIVASEVWEFGRFPAESGQTAEVWEDEIGSLNANLPNNCQRRESRGESQEGNGS